MKGNKQFWVIIIAFLGAVLYLPTLEYGYSADDGIYSYFNKVTRLGLEEWSEVFRYGSMNFIEINPTNTSVYRPLTLVTFSLERQIVGDFNPSVGHAINVVLYFFLLWVVGSFLLRLGEMRSLPAWIMFLVLALYALHPIHTEVVASVKSRDTLLSAVFAFASVVIWMKTKGKQGVFQWSIILGLYFLSLMSKEESIPFLALIFLVSWFFKKEGWNKSLSAVIPFFIPFILYMGLRAMVLDPANDLSYANRINSVLYAASGADWIATNFYIYFQYIKLLVFPHPLSWDYSYSQIDVQTFSNPWVWISVGIYGSLIYWAIKGFNRRGLYSFGILYFLTSFSIFANLTRSLIIGSTLGERFLFVPSLAFSFLVVFSLYDITQKKSPKFSSPILFTFLSLVGVVYSWKTFSRSQVWRSNITLTASGIETAPKSWRSHMMYADELRLKGKELEKNNFDSAKIYFEKAALHYKYGFDILGEPIPVPQYYNSLAEVLYGLKDSLQAELILRKVTSRAPKLFYGWFKLASLEYAKGNYEEAKGLYLKALEAKDADKYSVYKNLGNTYLMLKQNQEAVIYFEKARSEKEDLELIKVLSVLYAELGMTEKALEFQQDSTFNPAETEFLKIYRAGNDFFERKDYSNAVLNYRKIEGELEKFGGVEKYPSFYVAFGKALIETKDTLAAKQRFLKAFEQNPNNHIVLTNLGVISLLKDKQYQEAERYFRGAIRSNPDDPFSARVNLGTTLLLQKKEAEAILAFEDALKYGSSKPVLGNLYLLHKSQGNTARADYYKSLIQ